MMQYVKKPSGGITTLTLAQLTSQHASAKKRKDCSPMKSDLKQATSNAMTNQAHHTNPKTHERNKKVSNSAHF